MEQMGIAGLGLLAGYLAGAVPFGLLVGKLKGVDVRRQGSGNIGATNVGRVLGRNWGILVFFLDLLKGLLPVLLFSLWVGQSDITGSGAYLLRVLMAAAGIIGHMFPVYIGFKGGKGVATSLGALLGIYPFFTWPGLLAFGFWVVLTFTSRYVSVGSVGAAVAFPFLFAGFALMQREQWGTVQALWPLYLFAVVIAGLVVYRHRGNLRRLAEGTESRIGTSRRSREQVHG